MYMCCVRNVNDGVLSLATVNPVYLCCVHEMMVCCPWLQ